MSATPQPNPPEPSVRGAVTAERQRLAQGLHDTVCQTLTAAYFSAKFTEQKWQPRSPEVAAEIGELSELIHRAVGELHELMRELRLEETAAQSDGQK